MRESMKRLLWVFPAALMVAASACNPEPSTKQTASTPVPDSFKVAVQTSKGSFVVQVNRAWAPIGADRFYALVNDGFFDQARFFRAISNFVVQFGLNADPKKNEPWDKKITDDPVTQSNLRGTLTFATEGRNTRTHQLFINLRDNAQLDGMGFAPMGRVVQGMDVVDSLFTGYGDQPDQQYIQTLGNSYLNRMFPKMDYIVSTRVVP
jgi:peptidyl-prolyl cis-trans isomerase A (cyclophilin A)